MTFILQSHPDRSNKGPILTLQSSLTPSSPEQVREKFGDGYYVLKQTSPRMTVVWKGWLGQARGDQVKGMSQRSKSEIQKLKHKTDLLALGVGVTGVVEAVGFGLSHLRFQKLEEQVAQMKAVFGTFNASALQCPTCGDHVEYLLQSNCDECGSVLTWPKNGIYVPTNSEMTCYKCKGPLYATSNYCPSCGQPRVRPAPFLPVSESTWENGNQ